MLQITSSDRGVLSSQGCVIVPLDGATILESLQRVFPQPDYPQGIPNSLAEVMQAPHVQRLFQPGCSARVNRSYLSTVFDQILFVYDSLLSPFPWDVVLTSALEMAAFGSVANVVLPGYRWERNLTTIELTALKQMLKVEARPFETVTVVFRTPAEARMFGNFMRD